MSILHSWKINCVLKIGEGDATTCINYLRVALLFKKMYLTFSNITLFISVKHRIRKGSEEVSDFIDLWGFFFPLRLYHEKDSHLYIAEQCRTAGPLKIRSRSLAAGEISYAHKGD